MATYRDTISAIEYIVNPGKTWTATGSWNDEILEEILAYVTEHWHPERWVDDLLYSYDRTEPDSIAPIQKIERIKDIDAQGVLDGWDDYVGKTLGWVPEDTDASGGGGRVSLEGFRKFLTGGDLDVQPCTYHPSIRPSGSSEVQMSSDNAIGSFVAYLLDPDTRSLPSHIEPYPGENVSVSFAGETALFRAFKHGSTVYKIAVGSYARAHQAWANRLFNEFLGVQESARDAFFEPISGFAHTYEWENEDDETAMIKFLMSLHWATNLGSTWRHLLFYSHSDEIFKSVSMELLKGLDSGIRRERISDSIDGLEDFWDEADWTGTRNENDAAEIWSSWWLWREHDFHGDVASWANPPGRVQETSLLERNIDNIFESIYNRLTETIGGLETSGDSVEDAELPIETGDDSATDEPGVQGSNQAGESEPGAVDSHRGSSDTGDLDTWSANVGELVASDEFNDPNSSLYKYVAYYEPSSKHVEHFLVTYDQHENQHHSTNKTLRWDDTRQTRREAYNILICSDKVRNDFSLLPWPGSDASCARSIEHDDSASSVVPLQIGTCNVMSRISRRTIVLDFSECPLTADTLPGTDGIHFPNNGIKKIKIKREDRYEHGPFSKDDITALTFRFRRLSRSEDKFEDYFHYLQRLMAHADREGWTISGDLTSFPRFSMNEGAKYSAKVLTKNIDALTEFFVSENIQKKKINERRVAGTKNTRGRNDYLRALGDPAGINSHSGGSSGGMRSSGRSLSCNLTKFDAETAIMKPATEWTVSSQGRAEIKRMEGVRKRVYDDDPSQDTISRYDQAIGNPTIGVGHLIFKAGVKDERELFKSHLDGPAGIDMTNEEIDDLFTADLERHLSWKNSIRVPITQNMFDALASYAFNAGAGAPRADGIIRLINQRKYDEAAEKLCTSRVRGGNSDLQARRNAEAQKFLT